MSPLSFLYTRKLPRFWSCNCDLFIYLLYMDIYEDNCLLSAIKKKKTKRYVHNEKDKNQVFTWWKMTNSITSMNHPLRFLSMTFQVVKCSSAERVFFENLKKSEQALWLTKLARNRDFALGKWILILQQFWVMMTFKSCSVLLQLFS